MQTITVDLGERSYDIHVGSGLLSRAGKLLGRRNLSPKVIVVSSPTVLRLHGENLMKSLEAAKIASSMILIPDGERFKSLSTLESIYYRLSKLRADRKTTLIAFGGGVVGDIAGFAAASYLRGIPYVQIPTTLLAQIDSSIGGKTGVNLREGKNLVGAFYQPQSVLVDPRVLLTLPEREFRSGLYEAIKYGIIRDPALYDLVVKNHSYFPRRFSSRMEQMIVGCVKIKAEVVSGDEQESDLRMILNFGHTLGHALESATEYKRFTHGEAIGHGMILATQLALELGKIEPSETKRITRDVADISPLPSVPSLTWKTLQKHFLSDKKFVNQKLRFVLPQRIGAVEIHSDIPPGAVEKVVRAYLRARSL